MEIVTSVMSSLILKLAELLTDEYKLQTSLRGEIMFLKAELESMEAALEAVSEAPVNGNQVNIWASEVRELSYDIEDSIDQFMVCIDTHPSVTPQGFKGFISRSMRLLTAAKTQHHIATEIGDMKTLVKEVAERRNRYKVDSVVIPPSTAVNIDPRLHGIYEEPSKLIAICGPKEELSKLLVREGTSKQLKVISIVGVGGLGKTTLANVVYQQLKGQFECNAFVPVSLKPDMKRILSSILRQVSEQSYTNIETWDVVELINKIRQVLEDKRYLIVVDDIWDESAWNLIKDALVDNNCGSRVITTTRIAGIAATCCSFTDGIIYKLKPLSHNDSMKLFYKRIFGDQDHCHPELKEISEKILRKCYGVPLAIITIASLLANKPRNINQWNSVHSSIGNGTEKFPSMENMRQILSISYYDLPSHLKPCLLYLSIFPEDYTILRDQLIRRWIAEGIIHGTDVETLHNLGHNYFNELMNRSMIQPEHIDARGMVGACRVHDMVLDLITSLSTKENFAITSHHHQHKHLPRRIRRFSLHGSDEEHTRPEVALNLSHLRSLMVFPGATNMMPALSSFQVLRVLDLEGCRDLQNHQISNAGSLFHLRYLGLRDTNITSLPNEIGNLNYLQTLDLKQTSISYLPPTVVRLRQLMCLYIEPSVMLPDGIGNMESLQLLSSVGVSSSANFARELGRLTELRTLHISVISTWHENHKNSLVDSLCNLNKIQELHIDSTGMSTEFIVDLSWAPRYLKKFAGSVPRLPRWVNPLLSDLTTMIITLNMLRQEDIQSLGGLPFLQFLCLTVLTTDSAEERIIIRTHGANFQSLSEFHFHSFKMGLFFAQGAMPKLETLEVTLKVQERKAAYGDFDIGLENLSSIKQVIVRIRCTGSTVYEVDDADSALRRTAGLNLNHPKLEVIRYYEDEMVDAELQCNKETLKEEEKEERRGPWGGDGGSTRDITMAPKSLKSVKVCSAVVVDSLSFSYLDRYGREHNTPLWGGVGGSIRMINLGPSEFVKEVSGTYGRFSHLPNVITSFTLVTNLCSYGPFGQPSGTPFHTRVDRTGSIVGFFGRSGKYLDAIGVYVRPFES
ncbi:disease resistance protein RGA5 isoform X2 [Setaria viridis]|uniref:disease resistance protein RGA5 isoform X2 n=1 Tax=Setaria viridis TaxID=4556 RepID=UPI001493472F|nr:disease resistance protein RGA5-like isoform X2 [Setaria viridis]